MWLRGLVVVLDAGVSGGESTVAMAVSVDT